MMFWKHSFDLGSSLWANGIALSETATASGAVIEHRSRTIDAAIRSPFTADYAELGRMIPEKLEAFTAAGTALGEDWMAIQMDLFAQGHDIGMLFAGGWQANGATLGRISERGSRIALRMSKAGGRALAPVHTAATGNQRRLARRNAA